MADRIESTFGLVTGVLAVLSIVVLFEAKVFYSLLVWAAAWAAAFGVYRHHRSRSVDEGKVWLILAWVGVVALAVLGLLSFGGAALVLPLALCALVAVLAGTSVQKGRRSASPSS